jgi:hypothetical protein
MTVFTRLYDNYADATETVRDLELAGIDQDDISIVTKKSGLDRKLPEDAGADPDVTPEARSAESGEAIGAIVGGGVGLLAGLGILAIPGIGLVVAAGWLIATITGAGAGAAAGGLLGMLLGAAGLEKHHAHFYAEGVRRGGALVSVRVDDGDMRVAETIMNRHGPVDMAEREKLYRAEGWTGFDE